MITRRRLLGAGLWAAAGVACRSGDGQPSAAPTSSAGAGSRSPAAFLIEGATVFDGAGSLGVVDVLVQGDRIAKVGEALPVDRGVERVDAAGHTLLPGLIDAHTHVYNPRWLTQALVFGATTLLDMFTRPTFAATLRRQQQAGEAADRADLFSAGHLATAPDGHGTQFGIAVPTLTDPAQADSWVADRVEEGSDYIKVVLEDCCGFTPLDLEVARAVIDAAAVRGLLSIAHATTLAMARLAIDAGANGLAHSWADELPDEQLLDEAAERDVFMISTLGVRAGSQAPHIVLNDPRLHELLPASEVDHLEEFVNFAGDAGRFEVASQVTKAWAAAGLTLLAGTDAFNPAVVMGASLHAELELLVAAGLSPEQALRSATGATADAFSLGDRGRIEPGRRADLLVVNGDALEDVTATRNIVQVWKEGVPATPAALVS